VYSIKSVFVVSEYATPWWLHIHDFWLHRHDPNLLLLNYEDIVKVSIFARVMLTHVTHCEVPIYFLIKYKLMIVKLYIRVSTHMLIHIIFK